MDDMVMSTAQSLWVQANSMPTYTDGAPYAERYRLQHERETYDNWRKPHEYNLFNPGIQLHTPPWGIYEGTLEIEKKQSNRNILLLL